MVTVGSSTSPSSSDSSDSGTQVGSWRPFSTMREAGGGLRGRSEQGVSALEYSDSESTSSPLSVR